ncbi:MAG: ABC transporter ATP-binding protein [Bacteroidota bacterium]|jgi:ATP-binding cassette subfamily B multidrug efflux pump|nr:ABC transporter ATP-binding protein [Bacteroidota bacterium]
MNKQAKWKQSIVIGKRILKETAAFKSTFYLLLLLSIVLGAISILRPYLIQIAVDTYIRKLNWHGLVQITLIQLFILFTESGLRFFFLYRMNWLGMHIMMRIRNNVFTKILHQQLRYFDTTPIGTLTTRTINDVEALQDIFSEGFISIIADIITILAVVGVMLYTNWKLALVCLLTLPLILIATYFFKEQVRASFQEVRTAVAALNTFVQERLSNMHLIQAYTAEEQSLNAFQQINAQHRDANIKAIFAYSVFFPVVEIVLATAIGLLVWVGANQMLHQEITAGVIIAFIMYLNLLFRPLRMLADKFNVLQMGLVAAERVYQVVDHQAVEENKGVALADDIKGHIRFDQVSFYYDAPPWILNAISFEVPAGTSLAIVGATGSGKTTIVHLINRLYAYQQGQITIDGQAIESYELNSLRKQIGFVLQDVFLFAGSVWDNLTLQNPNFSEEQVTAVCKAIGVYDFIMQLPNGYQYQLLERGQTLSQGQRQLLSFARVLLYNPKIIILDEATASIDSESEQLIQKALDYLLNGRTSIIIAHRLSTIRKASQIMVLEKGVILERGNHATLLSQQGAYATLVQQKSLTNVL